MNEYTVTITSTIQADTPAEAAEMMVDELRSSDEPVYVTVACDGQTNLMRVP